MAIDFTKYPYNTRVRHHVASYFYFPASELKLLPVNYPPLIESLEWAEIFLNGKKPSCLDIGCGKGSFLIEYAQMNPDENILGIELRDPLVDWINGVIKGEGIANCASVWYSVANGLNFIESSSIRKIFYLFPDPWPKRRQQKRRAFNQALLQEFARVMGEDAELYIATDVPEVDQHQKEELEKSGLFDYIIVQDDSGWNLPVTNKEAFCRRKEIPLHRIICRKK